MSIVYFLWIGSILHLSGGLHNYWDGLQKNAGQHQLKNGIVQHSFRFPACGSQLRFSNIPPGHRSESNRIAQRIVVDEVVQFKPLRHSDIQRILDPGTVDRDHSPIPEQQLHAASVHVEFTNAFVVLQVCVLSALRHLYSCDFRDTVFLLIRLRTYSRQGRAGIFISEEHKKSEPFSYREKVRIFMVWCG